MNITTNNTMSAAATTPLENRSHMKRVNSNLLSSYLNSRFELTHSFWLRCCLLFLVTVSMVSEVWAASYQYTYYVVNRSGEIATQARATQAEGSAPAIPNVIKSSLLADGTAGTYSYYTVDQFDVASNIYTLHESPTALAALPSAATDIYVKYTYNNALSPIDLSGETIYYIKDQDKEDPTKVHYMTFNTKWTSADWRTDGSTNKDDNFGDNDKERQWVYEGNDPYKIYIRNVYRRDDNKDSYLRSDLDKGKFEDNNNVRYGGLTTNKLFNTFFFDTSGHIVAANNVYNWQNNTNKYIYYAKENKDSYGDIGGRFLTTGTARLNLTTLNIVKSTVTDATIHLVNQTAEPHKETFSFNTPIDTDIPKPSATVLARLERLGATLGTTYYEEAALTNEITTPLEVTDIYIPYTVDAATLSSTYNITFSTEENPIWFSMKINAGGGRLFYYDSEKNVIDTRHKEGENVKGKPAKKATDTHAQFAFIGDPYSFKIICKDLDGQYAFQDSTEASGFSNKFGNVRFSSSPEDTYSSFAIIGGTTSGTFQIFRRDLPFTTYRAFFDADGNGNQIWLYRYTKDKEVQAGHDITATPTPKYNYTYNIVDNNGRIAIKYTVKQEVSHRLDGEHGHKAIPEAIYSPYLKGETLTFYTFTGVYNAANLTDGNKITATPASDANIYVRYTTDILDSRSLPLDGKSYSVKVGGESGKYVKYEGGLSLSATLPNPRSDTDNFSKHVWYTSNKDPYNVRIHNNTSFSLFDNSTDTQFILMKGSSNDDTQVELLLASGKDISLEDSKSLALNAGGDAIELATTSRENVKQQVIFTDATVSVYYRIIDKQKKIVIEVEDKTATNLDVPAAWKSPLCTYHYWKRSDFIESGGIYTKKDGVSEITALSQATDGYIYVTYDVNSSLDLDGRNSDTKYMYRLQFTDSGCEEFYQEKSDGFMTNKTKAMYPYTNGDAGFYVYGSAQWEEQQYAASTRTRWAWILEGNDPYHTKISSFQTQTSEDGVARHAYFRTYIVNYDGSDHIVTGSITDNSLPVAAGDLPSDYMILGADLSALKLVTTNIVGTGTDGYASTAHRVVNSFEQYWKNNPTAQDVLGNSKLTEGGDDVTLTDAQRTLLKEVDDTKHKGAWHSYEAWANSAPWVKRADGTTSKKYGKHEHWFQTINMGDGTMTFQRVDLNGVLILLDNHGWEVARKPMGRLDNLSAKATLDAEIRKYDSPMVEQYTFWTNYDKCSGYHKYKPHNEGSTSKDASNKGTGTSLADYPEVKSNGMLQDLYVTYTVKPQYANAYEGAATEAATNVKTSFLIRQGDHLAKTDGTSIQTDDSYTSSIDAGSVTLNSTDNPEFFWCLRPNFNIDAEMGYNYNGQYSEKSKSETEQDYVDGVTAGWHNGFDPYNVQIYSYKTYKDHETNSENAIKYFVTNANNAVMVDRQHLESTDPADQTLSLGDNTEKFSFTAVDYDNAIIQATNATFLVVQDANGNMRLMPRFDHSRHINGFTALTTPAAAQPVEDKAHAQSTWLLRPPAQTYIVVDNQGREALRYTSLNDGAPVIPAKYRSPLANNFTFYKTLTETETDPHTNVYDLTTLAGPISTFAESGLSEGGTVYVRYEYNPDGDTDGLLKGTWYHAKLNDADVEVATTGVIKKSLGGSPSDEEKTAHRWRFKESAGDEPDPYAVTLWNGEETQKTDGKRYIVFHHSDYTDENRSYALMEAGNTEQSTTKYYFLDGSNDPATIVEQSGYITNGTISGDAKKLTLVEKVSIVNSVTFHIITTNGKEALVSDVVTGITKDTKLADVMPAWMKTPIMKDDAYIFHSAADYKSTTETYDVKGVPTTSPTTLDGSDVYVRYDYEKSKKAISDFGILGTELPLNVAPLDLSGNVKYVLTVGGENDEKDNNKLYGKRLEVANHNSIDYVNPTDINITDNKLTSESCVWTITGNDPYECTIHNGDKIIAGKWWDGDREAANDTDFPLAKLCTAKVATDNGYYSTFMVLRHNERESANPGKLKLYFTGHDNLWLAESNAVGKAQLNTNSSTGGLYVFKDSEPYKTRYDDPEGEPERTENKYKVFSRFTYRPVMTYHIITNSKKEALEGYSLLSDATVEMPEVYQSPLLNSSDFTYYTAATETDGTYTVTESTKTAASTTIVSLVTQKIGDIYVRYTYDRDKSPFKIATNISDGSEDGTRLSWIDERGLDLSGNTWYTIANMQVGFGTWHGTLLGANSNTNFKKKNVSELTNGRAPSDKEYLWKLEGDDPYAIKISNANYNGAYLTITIDNKQQLLSDGSTSKQTFMLLQAMANDNELYDFGKDSEEEPNYKLRRWTVLQPTGSQNEYVTTTTDKNATANLSTKTNWKPNGIATYDIRQSESKVVESRQIYNMGGGGGGTTNYTIEFVKAPVTRKYHYHAIKYDESGNKVGETWDAILEHDWLQKVVLEPIIARRFCKYEKRNTEAEGDYVTGTGEFMTQDELEAPGLPNAQFYSNPELTLRVKDGTGPENIKYDVYPEIDLEAVYDIYFKYQVDNDAKLSNRKLSDITSTPEAITNDATYYKQAIEEGGGGGRMGPDYTRQAKWFFMVLDTDPGITTKVDGTTRTPVGRQLFLRREDDGTVNWMNNNYTLHKEKEDNYKQWSYNRLAEWYRKGDNDAFREGRWLWAFIGDDPYNMRIINFESAVGVKAESSGVYSLTAADNCFVTISKGSTTSGDDTYPITIPTEEPTENQYWGICVGVNNSTEQTFSLLSTAITETLDNKKVSQPLYWHMVSHTANKVTTESVEGMLDYVPDRSYAIQLLPYEPLRYEDVKLVIRREDEVAEYKAGTKTLNQMTTGISKLYFAASERRYVAGDEIDTSAKDAIPLNVRRAFCEYTMYRDAFVTTDTKYTVVAGPYPTSTPTGEFDEDGRTIYTYKNLDGTDAPGGAQTIYASYRVTSDIFLKEAPTANQVADMAQNNDHVYFMDFPDTSGKDTYHHAYYDPMSTMREKTGDLKTQRDTKTGAARPEKRRYNSTSKQFEDDTDNWYNNYQYRTNHNRMESVPENLKWYFVGDPYKMQVYNVAGAHGAQLARFNPVESNFQFAIDCVHLRVKDPSIIDNRETLYPYNENGVEDTSAEGYHNRHYTKPYFDDFYWECVPTTSKDNTAFALRFKEDNQLLGYRNVYYYLAHDGLSKTYQQKNYSINLSYNADNEQHETGSYAGYHTANDVNTIIKLVQPVKVYVTAHRGADDRFVEKSNVVTDELSEYYGLDETITEVPRHLQRKFVQYSNLDNEAEGTVSEHKLSITNATSSSDCTVHTENVFKTGTKIDPVFKYTVYYTVDDLSKDQAGNDVHLFSPTTSTLNWVDMAVLGNGTNWLFFDKTGDNTKVTNYRTAIGDNTADGWNDGLKGLHWALVGDPYDFAILNRRRYEDGSGTDVQWLQVVKTLVRNEANTADSVIWVTQLADYDAAVPTVVHAAETAASSIADNTVNTHFSTQMWKLSPKNSDGTYKTGNSDAYYFLRTASLKTSTDDGVNGSATNQTSNYWRLVHKPYPDAASATSYFEMVPYSLSEKSNYSNTQYMSNYSKTMNGMGVYQQRLEIRTAVAKDEDEADNNCFDADVEIRTLNGVLKLKRSDMEIRYGDVEAALPASLRRYGCSYKCYLNYDPATNSGTEIINFGELVNEEGYAELNAAMTAAEEAHVADNTKSPRPLLTYVYTVDDATAQFFTTTQDARTDDYTWANSYFYWEQTYSGSSVEVERTRQVFDHYVYNSEGKIIDEVWREERYTEVVNNPTTPYPTKGYLNTHTEQTPVFADQTVQSSENYQKWSMTGDPYGFTLKNYAQYLTNANAIVSMNNTDIITQNYGDGQTFAYVVDKKGTPYLAIIDNNPESAIYGNITKLVDFEFSSTSNKTLMSVGNGINAADATGNSLATTYINSNGQTATVKPFYLANLMNYADMVDYHLVMAHQYSLDTDTQSYLTDDQKGKVNERMLEFLKYWGIQEHSSKDYFISTYDTDGQTPKAYDTSKESDIKTLLKEKGTLRNFLSYPVEDAIVERVGVDNKPQVPWYMKRQFCNYHMYQRDVQRSVVNKEDPLIVSKNGVDCYVWVNETEGITDTIPTSQSKDTSKWYKACNVKWESIFDKTKWSEWTDAGGTEGTDYETIDTKKYKIPSGYSQALSLLGVELDKIYECHKNRRVIIDVIYEVNTNRFRFAQKGRNTTAWYQMMTNNETADGLLNFSYKDGIGGRLDRTHHYTNNYLWAPEGDPYGFVLRSRYATINGTGFDDVAVTTEGKLPKGEDQWGNPIYKSTDGGVDEPFNEPTIAESKANYTGASSASTIPFDHKRIIHRRAGQDGATTDGATNAVYEMFIGGYDDSFLMHPTSAWMDKDDVDHESYYMVHNTATDGDYVAHRAYLRKYKPDDLRYLPDANWRLECTNEQLLPYFERAGYVGGLKPSVAQNFTNQEYRNRLRNGDTFTFTELTALQDLVYGGKFYKYNTTNELAYTEARPTTTGDNGLPLQFVSNNLVSMADGHYRIKAFSEDALNVDGNDMSDTGIKGITGPRYISGYRFESEKTDPNDANNNGGRWLHFFETDMTHSNIHTFADLKAKIDAVNTAVDASSKTAEEKAALKDRDVFDHTAMAGNIEILPADFDPSSIFQFTASGGYDRYKLSTQGLDVWVRPGGTEGVASAYEFGRTELATADPTTAEGGVIAFKNQLRLDDIGGAAVTLRTFSSEPSAWDGDVAENLKTNYICIDGHHRYRITCHTNNEMVEIGDHYTTDGLNGIQDTKWLLQPVGIHEEWPYNEMPLRVEVQQGGVKDQELTGADLISEDNKDKNYYGSLYVPFDSRLSNTTDAAFTLTSDAKPEQTTVTMQSVSQFNGMGNPQYVPAGWPVVIRTNLPGSITLKNQDATDYATKHYVNMYLPYATPQTGLDDEKAQIKLRGEYLERILTNSYIDGIESKTIMVFGIPFANHDNTHHEYARDTKQVGWYTNHNWARESAPTATARTATDDDDQRNNKYVYHNKVYYPYTIPSSAPRHIIAIFDDVPKEFDPYVDTVTDDVPWPCDVYDLSGRKVASNETPATLLLNHPELAKGLYIFGGRKMVIK